MPSQVDLLLTSLVALVALVSSIYKLKKIITKRILFFMLDLRGLKYAYAETSSIQLLKLIFIVTNDIFHMLGIVEK